MMPGPKKKLWLLYFLMLVFELLIAWFILSTHGFNFYQGGDSSGYMYMAKYWIDNGALPPTNFRTPGYLLILAIIYLIFHSFIPAIFFGALISAFAAPLIYLIAREIFSEKIAFGAGILTAVEPMGLFSGVSILTDGIFTSILLLSTYFFIRYLSAQGVVPAGRQGLFSGGKTSETSYLYSAGALLALASLIRPIMFYCWPIAIPFILHKEYFQNRHFALKKVLVFVSIFFLILSPWLIRNKIVVNSWQISSLQGYVFFIDHYGAVLRYLGEAGPLSDVQTKALALVPPDKIFTSEGSNILFKVAVDGIKQHKLAYVNVYVESMLSFFIANGYKSLFVDILGIKALIPQISPEIFLRFDFKSIFKTFSEMNLNGLLIYTGSKIFWAIVLTLFLISLVSLFWKKNDQMVLRKILFIATIIFYFALMTGPTVINSGGRSKVSINGLIFIFFVFGADMIIKWLKIKTNVANK